MAEIVLTPFLQVIFEKLSSPLIEELLDMWELEGRYQKLRGVLKKVQAVIQDADGKQVTDKAVKVWLSELKDAAYKAEDFFEELIYKREQPMTNSINLVKTRRILDNLQRAASDGLNLNLYERTGVDRCFDKRETSSFIRRCEVVGREEDERRILEKLLSPSSSAETLGSEGFVPVIPIVGLPGIGKTTVVQSVYNNDEVKKEFDLRIWVFVSDEFKVKKIMKAAIESATQKKCELSDLDGLQSELWNTLSKKKYLLVLDDVWNDDENEWDKLSLVFGAGVHGSRILVTTRSRMVAQMVDTQNLAYELKGLSESSCWDLFKRHASLGGEEAKNHNLMVIGKEIVRKCGGVPLAVKTLGSLMRYKREEREWLYVQDSDLWNLDVYQLGILPALQLSYQQLPSHLKRCFAFCSIFPRSYEFKKEKIVHMWIAHDLVPADEGNRLLEDIGDEYFSELLCLSFFEDVKECQNGSAPAYKINELFYTLAQSAMKNESIILGNAHPGRSCSQMRHASCVSAIPESLFQATHLRTLIMFSGYGIQEASLDVFSRFIYLRVLDFSCCCEELPESLGKLRLLEYLDLSYGHFKKLPRAISSLRHLGALNLIGCYNLQHLPSVRELTRLRHLNISGCEALTKMPRGISSLLNLQTLPIFIVELLRPKPILGLQFMELQGELKIKHLELQGELKIKHLERVRSTHQIVQANLADKRYIKSLGLCWGHDGADLIMNPALESNMVRFQERKHQMPGPSQEPETVVAGPDPFLAMEVLKYLHPHCNLKNLFVVGYPGIKFSQWVLPNLTKLVLIKCRGCLQLPTLGQLPSLRTLRMEEFNSLERIGEEFYGDNAVLFPSLQELFMQDFPLLREWSSVDGKESFPKLSKLTMRKCPNLILVPSFMSIHHLQLRGCNPRILGCMDSLTSLSSLVIEGFDDLVYLPGELFKNNYRLEHLKISSCPKLRALAPELGSLTSLKSLIIQWCGELHLIPDGFWNLIALENLEISDCNSLVALPDNAIGGLRSLRTLSLENCNYLASISLGLQYLTALQDLTIMYCPSLASLPDTMKHLSALRSFSILSCPQIEFLPEGFRDVITLQSLEIRSCSRLAALPEWLDRFSSLRSLAISDCPNMKYLPVAVRNLPLLQHLSIQGCPELQNRCQPDRGADWWKIAHVPYRYILSSQLQTQSIGVASSSN